MDGYPEAFVFRRRPEDEGHDGKGGKGVSGNKEKELREAEMAGKGHKKLRNVKH